MFNPVQCPTANVSLRALLLLLRADGLLAWTEPRTNPSWRSIRYDFSQFPPSTRQGHASWSISVVDHNDISGHPVRDARAFYDVWVVPVGARNYRASAAEHTQLYQPCYA